MGLGSKGDSEPAWVLVSLGERRRGLGVSGIGLRDVACGKGTVEEEEEEEENERVGWSALHVEEVDVVSLEGGVQGVADMLQAHKQVRRRDTRLSSTHLARDQYQSQCRGLCRTTWATPV